MSPPTVSVIIPVYNRQKGAQRAVDSVRAQVGVDPTAVEIVVVDDASDPPISIDGCTLVRLDTNGGAGRARNAGVAASQGEFIAFLDSDDLWTPEKLSHQIQTLETLPDLAVLASGYLYPGKRIVGEFHSRIPVEASDLERLASGCWSCPGSTLIMRRNTFDLVGPFDESLRRLEDLDWQLRLGLLGGSLHTDPVIGAVIKPGNARGLIPVTEASRHLTEKFGPHGSLPLSASAYRRLRAYLALEQAAASRGDGRMLDAIICTLRSLALAPRARLQIEKNWTPGPQITPEQLKQIDAILAPLEGEA